MQLSTLKKRLGDILVDVGIITPEILKKALDAQKITGEKLGTILSEMGAINEEVMLAFLGKQCGISYISLSEYGEIPTEVLSSVPDSVVRHQKLIPISKENNTITIAMADPFNVFAVDDIKVMTGLDVQVVIASESEIKQAIDKYYWKVSKLKNEIKTELKSSDDLVNSIIEEGFNNGATDIHLDPQIDSLSLRYRIDGIIHEHKPLPKKLLEPIITRLKAMTSNKSSESAKIFEGKIKVIKDEHKVDLKVSIIPSIFGEKTTIQILNDSFFSKDLAKLGFETESLAAYKKNIESINGLIIAASPVYSGKTTTLYSTIEYLNHSDRNIITVEDSPSHIIHGVTQIEANYSNGINFASAVRSLVQHNPDIIMVDEILEQSSAKQAINFALSGRLVLGSLSMDNSFDAISHLISMGVEPYILSSSLRMIIAQRLMRLICPKCKESYSITAKSLGNIGIDIKNDDKTELWRGKGCTECNYTGYKDRIAIFEILEIDDKLRELIMEKASKHEMRQYAESKGFKSIREAAWRKVRAGVTTAEEMLRITKYSD